MRRIGQIQDADQARRFLMYAEQQISGVQIVDEGEKWAVWVDDEDQLDQARGMIDEFLADPDADKFVNVEIPIATPIIEASLADEAQPTSVQEAPLRRWGATRGRRFPIRRGYTLCLTLLPVLGAMLIGFNVSSPTGRWMAFCDEPTARHGADTMDSILAGEVWRLWSPCFVYSDVRHLFFGVVFVYVFGVRIESLRGPLPLLLLFLGAAVFSNVAQAIAPTGRGIEGMEGGADFGGMSSVAYAMFAYVWVQSIRFPRDRLSIDTLTIIVMVSWLGICLFSPEWRFPNVGHFAGLTFGVIVGYMSGLVVESSEPADEGSETS